MRQKSLFLKKKLLEYYANKNISIIFVVLIKILMK